MIDACPDSAVLFFDVDGTLTSFDPDNMTDKDFSAVHPSQAVIEAFHRLRDAGHQAFICTGRPLWLIADGLRALNPAGVVAMAGATLEVEGRVVHEDCFDEDVIEELTRRMAAAGIEAFFETNVATFALEPAGVEQPSLIGTSVVHSAEEMRVDGRLRVGKVCIVASYLARVANDDGFIDREFELCNTGGQNRELSPKGIDKGVGVARALAYWERRVRLAWLLPKEGRPPLRAAVCGDCAGPSCGLRGLAPGVHVALRACRRLRRGPSHCGS